MIQVQGLQFSYTKQPFIQNMNFDVRNGEIFGFLGPSGAGKSTLQKILTGLLTTYEGSVQLNGTEVKHHDNSFYENIGVDFEFPSLYSKLTARENLHFFASLYKKHQAIDPLLDSVGLLADAEKKVSAFSKGMKSRLNFIKALLHEPSLLFLDEPTSGLDPSNARRMKDIILQEKAKGKTILLTTHNMYDATELCDRVAFIVDGKLRALDTPRNLIMLRGASKVRYTYTLDGREELSEIPLNETGADIRLQRLVLENRLLSIHSSEPTLNDIFVELTGRQLQ
ncbi:ABC transporter ATP-binding protein [Anaerocolumna cellulosilytica]|uniref:ABC transporter ATP-binding protein n=1 Tax=Anaerocolumna cellulosilytica TaxID=433286 RepID=A0A6S6QZH4_9FIRM|nr:ABC transporter ATP-binding protein [Anaerocolumna cellulosilytica]MBB5195109.1 fluoroquinolone transport system ATP-binding protein [Anaerocolumna cellulosilytica]BCJ96054.1 ABC transporter ATP-binding protein [Anaerocolumna cellulosilytica]